MTPDQQRFAELLSLALDGACTDAEQEEFSRLEHENPQWVVDHIDTIFTHNLLQWQNEDISDCMTLELAASARDNADQQTAAHSSKSYRQGLWALAAAIAFLTCGLWLWRTPHTEPIAEVVAQNDVTWASDSSALRPGNLVVPGRLQNTAGSFTIQFHSGPTVKIAGPAMLDIKSAMLVNLERGQATTRIPKSSKGFTIKTPVAKVVDQGTEFGVAARDDGRTDVVVFEGSVDVRETAGEPLKPKSLIMGEGARIDDQGAIDRIMQIGRDSAGGWWTEDRHVPSEGVIKLVRDIYTPADNAKFFCYQIIVGGLADDVFAYADHPHQWNGLTAEGLPEFLRGADYVKTFNDYRYLKEFQMDIELLRPADLYVFADDRVAPPKWLTDQFTDTGVDIGLDEGPWEGILDHANDVGGGRSIDTIFSVWHRRCEDLTPVTLGDVGKWGSEGPQGRAMYGIAAKPLDESPATMSDSPSKPGGI